MGCSGYLVRDGDTAIVLDLGPGTLPELKRHIDPRLLDGLVLSHGHLDHSLDLGALRYSLKYSPVPADAPIDVYIPPGFQRVLDHLALAYAEGDEATHFYDGALRIVAYDPRHSLQIGEFSISFSPCVHYLPCWAMRVTSKSGAVLGYTADTGPAAPLDGFLRGVSVLVAEATLLKPGLEPFETRGHLTAFEAGELATRVGCRTLVLTHIWEESGFDRAREQAAQSFHGRI
ncbi:MAG: MBL fold metallo-hydrolase, partial [Thermomicrobiales bacterium]|nr:MBL fold metallo-hydrolase [Thermomicrobiales bacterium]